jgi:hypothetical protein
MRGYPANSGELSPNKNYDERHHASPVRTQPELVWTQPGGASRQNTPESFAMPAGAKNEAAGLINDGIAR